MPIGDQQIGFCFKLICDLILQLLECFGVRFPDDLVNDCGERYCSDIGEIHSDPWDDEFPASGDGVVSCVFEFISKFDESWYNDIVIGVLREAESFTGQFSRAFQKFVRGLR